MDLDGLEGVTSLQTLQEVVVVGVRHAAPVVTKVGATTIASLALITARGVSDALYNANTVGLYDAFGGNHLSSYSDEYEQAAYLRGRLGGDAIATAQSLTEIHTGGGAALTTGMETAGVGAVAGGVLAAHGVAMGATAAADAGWSLKKLYQLNISGESSATTGETIATKRGRDAHDNYNPGDKYTVDRRSNKLENDKIPDAIYIKGNRGIVRE